AFISSGWRHTSRRRCRSSRAYAPDCSAPTWPNVARSGCSRSSMASEASMRSGSRLHLRWTANVRLRAKALALILLLGLPERRAARAHGFAPSLLDMVQKPDGQTEMTWRTPLFGFAGPDLRPTISPPCEMLGTPTAEQSADSLVERWTVHCGKVVGRRVSI